MVREMRVSKNAQKIFWDFCKQTLMQWTIYEANKNSDLNFMCLPLRQHVTGLNIYQTASSSVTSLGVFTPSLQQLLTPYFYTRYKRHIHSGGEGVNGWDDHRGTNPQNPAVFNALSQ